MPIAVLTDGRKWSFFHLMGLEYYRELKVRELDLIEGNSEEIADCLNRYLNYQSICSDKAIRTMKKDYERVYKQKIESKPMPSIPPELHHVIKPPNAEDNKVFSIRLSGKLLTCDGGRMGGRNPDARRMAKKRYRSSSPPWRVSREAMFTRTVSNI